MAAAERWPRDGKPDNPRAWLVTTARNRAIDRLRRDRALDLVHSDAERSFLELRRAELRA